MTTAINHRHWWWKLPEAGPAGLVMEMERIMNDIDHNEKILAQQKAKARSLNETIAERALEQWTLEEVTVAVSDESLPSYLGIPVKQLEAAMYQDSSD